MLGLMLLIAYVSCFDRRLVEHLNGNINFQLFCDIFLQGERMENFKIVSQVCTYLSGRLNIKLNKLLCLLSELKQEHADRLDMPARYFHRVKIITKVLVRQQAMFEAGESIPNRGVSLSKSYKWPIVRGKEVKPVEFGDKVNMIQFDGINFIEHLSFNAFHEGITLKQSVSYAREPVGAVTHLSNDDIYDTNANRTYCKLEGIVHGFKPKGRPCKHAEHHF